MRCWPKIVLLVFFLLATKELRSSGDQQRMISTPYKPTRVFIGENVSLVWKFYQPSHLTLFEVVFGIWKSPGYLKTKLVTVHSNGIPSVRSGYGSKVSWAGNLTSCLAVFVLYYVQPTDGNKIFAMHVEFGLAHNPLTDIVRLQVEEKPIADLPKIYHITTPHLLRIGQNVSLNCTASGLSPVEVTWYKGRKALASGISKAVLTLKDITDVDWGEILCVAKNSAGEDKKSVILKVLPESPTIINTNKKVRNASWTLRWSAVYSEGKQVTFYTVWHRVEHVIKDSTTPEKPWLWQNVSGLMYYKELTANTSYLFAVTAWNRWGESLVEEDKTLSISTDFPDKKNKTVDKATILIYTEPETSVMPSSSNRKSDNNKAILVYIPLSVILCILLLVVLIILVRTKCNRSKKINRRYQDQIGMTPHWLKSQEDRTSEAEEDAVNETRSIILAESLQSMSSQESPLVLEIPGASVRNMQENFNQQRTEECFEVTAFRPEINTTTSGPEPYELSSSSGPFTSCRGSERSEPKRGIHMPVMKTAYCKAQNEITKEISAATAVVGAVCEGVVQLEEKGTTKFKAPDTFGENGNVTDTFTRVTYSGDYLQPVDNDSLQFEVINRAGSRQRHGKAQSLTHNRPQPKPRIKFLKKRVTDKLFQYKDSTVNGAPLSLQSTAMLESNPLDDREAAQYYASVKPADQSNRLIPQTRTCHGQQHDYQNERCTTTPYQNSLQPTGSAESPYTRVLSNTNWEVSRDHLTLFERIGGGSFGQVWKGAVLDVAGAKGWSFVAVKMLKENSSKSDLRDLLSELNLLKKLKPHPNVIQLLGCLTKDVIRCKGGREFRPPLVILEFVPYGDLLGYLKKSKGETDDYYNLKSAEVSRKIPKQQLYKFACDIARGMEFLSAHQLIHRDLAARNVLVGEGLRCKITDFGMARDLGKNEIYFRRSNGLMPVKWMAVESLTSQVFTTESDVWSYGIVVYEIFTLGGRPYEGMTGEEVFNYVASGNRLPRTSTMTSELYNLMLQCWHENPYKRPTFASIVDWMETVTQDHL
ncbi:uncharacterized protein LOC144654684 isoform X2 [Oculina patagonica]